MDNKRNINHRKNAVKIENKVDKDRILYDVDCSIISNENCGSHDSIFSLCKLEDNVCIRDTDKNLNIEYVKRGNIEHLGLENRLSSNQINLIKYLSMNLNLYENCDYGDNNTIDNLTTGRTQGNDYNLSHQKVVDDIIDYINNNICKGKHLNSIKDITNCISKELLSINEAELSEYITEKTSVDSKGKMHLPSGKNKANDLIIYLSGIVGILKTNSEIRDYIDYIIKSSYTNTCDMLNFKRGSKNIFNKSNAINRINDFNKNELHFMKSLVDTVKTKKIKFFNSVTRSESDQLADDIQLINSDNRSDYISDSNLVGKLGDSLKFVDSEGDIDKKCQIFYDKFYKLGDIIGLVEKIRFYLDYYPEIKEEFIQNHEQYIIDDELYFENIIILPYMNAAYILLLYYPVIEYLVDKKYII